MTNYKTRAEACISDQSHGKIEMQIEAAERYRLIAENSVDLIWMANFDTLRYTYISPASIEMLGFKPEELIGVSLLQLLTPESRRMAEEIIARMQYEAAHGLPIELPHTVQADQMHKDGSIVNTETTLIIVEDAAGNPRYLYGITRDVTERHTILAKLRAKEEELERAKKEAEEAMMLYRMLAEQSEDMIWVIDVATRRYTYVNPATQKVRGYAPDEIIGTVPGDKLSPASRTVVENLFKELEHELANALEIAPVPPIEIEVVHKNGHIVYTETTVSPIKDETGRPVSYLGISRDISHRKQIEAERRLREEELRQAKELAEEANRAKTLFLANMSHEIRTPLSALVGLSQVMVSQSALLQLPEDFVRMMAQVNAGGRYLNMMLTNLLDISAVEHGTPRLHLRLSSLAKWSQGTRDILEPIARQREVVLRWHDEELATAKWRTDPVRLSQVLINLVHNAIKFTPAGKAVDVAFEWRADCFAVEVSDEGPGLPPEQKDAFDAFSTGTPSISDIELYVVQLNVQLLGGRITCCNKACAGTCFRIDWACGEKGEHLCG